MASTLSSTQAESLFDDGAAPVVSKDLFGGVEETLARLAHQAASDTPDPRPRVPESDKATDARTSRSSAAAMLGPADLSAQIPREQRSLGKRGTRARVAIAVCLGAAAIWAWRSYGGPARDMIAALAPPFGLTSARPAADHPPVARTPDPVPAQTAAPPAVEKSPPPAQTASIAPPATTAANEPAATSAGHRQIDAMARDVAALRQTVEQLAAGQEQLKGELAKLAAERSQADNRPTEKPKKRMLRHVSAADRPSDAFNPALNPNAPGVPHTLGSVVVRRGAPPSASGVSTLGPLSPPPPPAPAAPPRPPMPVQQP